MIEWNCYSCGRTLKAKEQIAGRRAKCTHCNYIQTIPQDSEGDLETNIPASPAKRRMAPALPRRRPVMDGAAEQCPLELRCRHCCKEFSISEDDVGEVVECSHCKWPIRIREELVNNVRKKMRPIQDWKRLQAKWDAGVEEKEDWLHEWPLEIPCRYCNKPILIDCNDVGEAVECDHCRMSTEVDNARVAVARGTWRRIREDKRKRAEEERRKLLQEELKAAKVQALL